MESILLRIARDVAGMASSVRLPGGEALRVEMDAAPDFDLARIGTRKCVVTPQEYARSNATRGGSDVSAKVHLFLVEKIGVQDVESRVAIMETIATALERGSLVDGGSPYAVITAVEFNPVYEARLLRNSHVFLSVCTVTVKVIR